MAMQKLSDDANNTRVALAKLATRLDSIDTDYSGLSAAVVSLGKRIDDLGSSINAKIDQRSQPQWPTYISGAMLLGGLFFAFISPIQQNQTKADNAIIAAREASVSRDEYREYKLRIDNAIGTLHEDLTRLDVHLDQRLDHISSMLFGKKGE